MDVTIAPLHIHFTVPPALLLAIGAIIILLILVRIGTRRRRRTVAPTRRRAPQQRIGARRRVDHGARIASKHGKKRSPEWERVEKEHLVREPACAACGYEGRGLQVHHIKPFHLHPALELDPNNLITLCEIKGRDHHLLIGHLDEWESYNERVRTDVKRFHKMSADQIRANSAWQEEVRHRPR